MFPYRNIFVNCEQKMRNFYVHIVFIVSLCWLYSAIERKCKMNYDVVIVGASISGCTAATLYARKGLRVALLERESSETHYKILCSHFIQNSAVPTINKLGLMDDIMQQGGMRHCMELWTRWGWINPRKSQGDGELTESELHKGITFRREKLDPMLRNLSRNTDGVDFFPGHSVKRVIEKDGCIVGVDVKKRKGAPDILIDDNEFSISANLVVIATGRFSKVDGLPKITAPKTKPNNRFCYLAFYKNIPLISEGDSQVYFLDPDVASVFPKDDGLSLLVLVLHADKEAEFKSDIEGNFVKYFKNLESGPDMKHAERSSKIIGYRNLQCFSRKTTAPGLAFVGDAACGGDPLWGIGCGWAFQSADWLVSETAKSLISKSGLSSALESYEILHKKKLGGYLYLMEDYATGRTYNVVEKLLYSGAARDRSGVLARALHDFASRNTTVFQFISIRNILRSLWINLRYIVGASKKRIKLVEEYGDRKV